MFFHQFLKGIWPFPPQTSSPHSAYITQQKTTSWSSLCKNHLASGKQLRGPPHHSTAICIAIHRTLQHTSELGGQLWPTIMLSYYSICRPTFPSLSCSYIGTEGLILAKGLWAEMMCVTLVGSSKEWVWVSFLMLRWLWKTQVPMMPLQVEEGLPDPHWT